MKVLFLHNQYQLPGGEDVVYRRECELLRRYGHEVIEYQRDNREIAQYGFSRKASLALRTIWASDSYREVAALIKKESPDVAHFHNAFPLISPAAYYACAAANVPVVQTLHNPRLLCPAATLFRSRESCERCSGKLFAWPAIRYGCYQNSSARSAVVASMLSVHNLMGTWTRKVDTYIVSTDFYRQKFAAAGLPSKKLFVKPHFVDTDPGPTDKTGDYALFIGRLSPEKGIGTLLRAWNKLRDIPLCIRGEGPLLEQVTSAANDTEHITLKARANRTGLFEMIKNARFLVWPSEGYYETFGLVAIEAFACAVPVIASRIGVMREIVEDGHTGLHFNPGDADNLSAIIRLAWDHPEQTRAMGRNARAEYEHKYAAERNFMLLLQAYNHAMKRPATQEMSTPEMVRS